MATAWQDIGPEARFDGFLPQRSGMGGAEVAGGQREVAGGQREVAVVAPFSHTQLADPSEERCR